MTYPSGIFVNNVYAVAAFDLSDDLQIEYITGDQRSIGRRAFPGGAALERGDSGHLVTFFSDDTGFAELWTTNSITRLGDHFFWTQVSITPPLFGIDPLTAQWTVSYAPVSGGTPVNMHHPSGGGRWEWIRADPLHNRCLASWHGSRVEADLSVTLLEGIYAVTPGVITELWYHELTFAEYAAGSHYIVFGGSGYQEFAVTPDGAYWGRSQDTPALGLNSQIFRFLNGTFQFLDESSITGFVPPYNVWAMPDNSIRVSMRTDTGFVEVFVQPDMSWEFSSYPPRPGGGGFAGGFLSQDGTWAGWPLPGSNRMLIVGKTPPDPMTEIPDPSCFTYVGTYDNKGPTGTEESTWPYEMSSDHAHLYMPVYWGRPDFQWGVDKIKWDSLAFEARMDLTELTDGAPLALAVSRRGQLLFTAYNKDDSSIQELWRASSFGAEPELLLSMTDVEMYVQRKSDSVALLTLFDDDTGFATLNEVDFTSGVVTNVQASFYALSSEVLISTITPDDVLWMLGGTTGYFDRWSPVDGLLPFLFIPWYCHNIRSGPQSRDNGHVWFEAARGWTNEVGATTSYNYVFDVAPDGTFEMAPCIRFLDDPLLDDIPSYKYDPLVGFTAHTLSSKSLAYLPSVFMGLWRFGPASLAGISIDRILVG